MPTAEYPVVMPEQAAATVRGREPLNKDAQGALDAASRYIDAERARGVKINPRYRRGELAGLALGVKPGVIFNQPPDAAVTRDAFAANGRETVVVGNLAVDVEALQERARQEPDFARSIGWDDAKSVEENLAGASAVDIEAPNDGKIGFALGFPESVVRGYLHEAALVDDGIPKEADIPLLLNGLERSDAQLERAHIKGAVRRLREKLGGPAGAELRASLQRIGDAYGRSNDEAKKVPWDTLSLHETNDLHNALDARRRKETTDDLAKVYSGLGVSKDDADFMTSRRRVIVTDPSGKELLYTFVAYEHPAYGGEKAPDVIRLKERVAEAFAPEKKEKALDTREKREEEKARIDDVRRTIDAIGRPAPEAAEHVPPEVRRSKQFPKAQALERALGVPIDKTKAVRIMENSKTLDPLRYFLRAKEYSGSFWKAFKMTFTTGGFRDSGKDAVFKNAWNNLSPGETQLHETLHAVSEGADAPKGKDILGGERAVSGVEALGADGKIKLTALNEGLTQFFTLKAREELKMRGPKALGSYTKEVAVVRKLAEVLDANGQDGRTMLAKSFVERDAGSVREALDRVGGAGAFDRLADAMDAGDMKGAERMLAGLLES